MFSPKGMGLERGWPGRVDGDRVIQLAAQTLQVYFTAGGALREHAEYALADIDLRPPVLQPPGIRIFGDGLDFAHAAALYGLGWERAQDVESFRAALGRALTADRSTIVCVRTDRDENVRVHRRVWEAVRAAAGSG